MWEEIKKLFETRKTCRCCGTKIENGGYGVALIGSGFCINCYKKLTR